jgi:hypothetical protein
MCVCPFPPPPPSISKYAVYGHGMELISRKKVDLDALLQGLNIYVRPHGVTPAPAVVAVVVAAVVAVVMTVVMTVVVAVAMAGLWWLVWWPAPGEQPHGGYGPRNDQEVPVFQAH